MDIQTSIDSRIQAGMERVSIAEFTHRWKAAGFRFDPSCTVTGTSRYITGKHAGETELHKTLYPVRIETGRSAYHYQTPDKVRQIVKQLRDSFFAVSGNRIIEV